MKTPHTTRFDRLRYFLITLLSGRDCTIVNAEFIEGADLVVGAEQKVYIGAVKNLNILLTPVRFALFRDSGGFRNPALNEAASPHRIVCARLDGEGRPVCAPHVVSGSAPDVEKLRETVARDIARGCRLDPDAASPKAAEAGHDIPEWMFFLPAADLVIEGLGPLAKPDPAAPAEDSIPVPRAVIEAVLARDRGSMGLLRFILNQNPVGQPPRVWTRYQSPPHPDYPTRYAESGPRGNFWAVVQDRADPRINYAMDQSLTTDAVRVLQKGMSHDAAKDLARRVTSEAWARHHEQAARNLNGEA